MAGLVRPPGLPLQALLPELPPRNYVEAKQADTVAFRRFWERMLQRGVFVPPSQFETNFLSVAHGEAEMAKLREAYASCLL